MPWTVKSPPTPATHTHTHTTHPPPPTTQATCDEEAEGDPREGNTAGLAGVVGFAALQPCIRIFSFHWVGTDY